MSIMVDSSIHFPNVQALADDEAVAGQPEASQQVPSTSHLPLRTAEGCVGHDSMLHAQKDAMGGSNDTNQMQQSPDPMQTDDTPPAPAIEEAQMPDAVHADVRISSSGAEMTFGDEPIGSWADHINERESSASKEAWAKASKPPCVSCTEVGLRGHHPPPCDHARREEGIMRKAEMAAEKQTKSKPNI